jgi:hypothetical protein
MIAVKSYLSSFVDQIIFDIQDDCTRKLQHREPDAGAVGAVGPQASEEDLEQGSGVPGGPRPACTKIKGGCTLRLVENGTHVVWAARGSNYANGEITLAQNVEPAPRKALVGLKPT